jgi:dolichyl-phosphate-mannose-protein mannosyltransferase
MSFGKSMSAGQKKGVLCTVFILALSYFTYFHNYASPSSFYWDENYHIPSAQKYQNGKFFLQQHPPLGKLLIALGEELLDKNEVDDQMVGVIHEKTVPDNFSFAGYRFFPVLLAWLTSLLVLWMFYLLTKNWLIATALSFLYVFDNAFILHNRGAMLEAPMLFFTVATILVFLLMLQKKHSMKTLYGYSLLFGVMFGLTFMVKLLGLILILLFPAALVALRPHWKHCLLLSLTAFVGFFAVFIAIWQIHFSIVTEPDEAIYRYTFYTVSEKYLSLLEEERGTELKLLPFRLQEYVAFTKAHNVGVPRLDISNKFENGSPFFLWPIGARTINYRWQKFSEASSYLYLVPNPVGWAAGLLGVVVAMSFLISSAFFPLKKKLQNPYLLLVFSGMYFSYLIAVAQIERVMYLYHYFLPLLFSFALFALISMEIREIGKWKVTEKRRAIGMLIFACVLVASHQFYRPFTYNLPITDEQFERRNLLRIWNMRCVDCEHYDSLVIPKHEGPPPSVVWPS